MNLIGLFRRMQDPWRFPAIWAIGLTMVGLSLVAPSQVDRLTNLFTGTIDVRWQIVRRALLYLIGAQLALSLLSYARRRIEVALSENMTRILTLEVFSRVVKFSPDFFRDSEVEKINARALEDTNVVARFWIDATVGVPLGAVTIFFLGSVMLVRNPVLGMCTLPVSLLSGYFFFFDKRIQALNARGRETWDTIRAEANELVSVTSELRNHYAFEYGQKGLWRSFYKYRAMMTEVGQLTALFQAANPLVACIQMGVLYYIGAWLCLRNATWPHTTWGDVIGFMLLAQLFQRPVSDIAGFVLQWRMSRESARRVSELFERPCVFERMAGAPAVPDATEVRFEKVSVVTPSGARILNALETVIRPGEHVAICGPAGCGKSTAIQLIPRNVTASSGRLALGGECVEYYDPMSLAQRIGFLPQKPVILDASLRNNILLGLRRPSGGCLEDREGSLDIVCLPDIKTVADLERRLVEIVRAVGLDADVFQKCLDSEARAESFPRGLLDELPALRQQIAMECERYSGDLIPFDPLFYIPGTVGENLEGPCFAGKTASAGAVAEYLNELMRSTLLDELLELGHRRFRQEHTLTAQVLQHAPSLATILHLRPRNDAADLAAELDNAGPMRLKTMPRRAQLALLEAAFTFDGPSNYGEQVNDGFELRIVQARRQCMSKRPGLQRRWEQLNSNELFAGLSVRDNLLRGRVNPQRRETIERIDSVIRNALENRNNLSDALLLGLEYRSGEGGKFLSGGQKQKISLARVLMKNPNILLLDEATAAMDEVSQRRATDLISSEFRGKTVVSISHRLSTVKDFDRIIVLDRGRVVEEGHFDELVTRGGLFGELAGKRFGSAMQTTAPSIALKAVTGEGEQADVCRQLAVCQLFSHLSSERLTFVAQAAKFLAYQKGETLFSRGDSGTELFLILEGEIQFLLGHGLPAQDKIVTTFRAGRSFGEVAVFGSGIRSLTAQAVQFTRVAVFSRDRLFEMMSADPQIAIGLIRGITMRMNEITDNSANGVDL